MESRRNLCWKLNWYRQSELEGALLLGKMVRAVKQPELILALTRHCAEEARHAWLWADTLTALALPLVRIFRSYQSFYNQEGGMPSGLLGVLALTHVFELRVRRQFMHELVQPGTPHAVQRTLRIMLKEEEHHLEWVAKWLRAQSGGRELLRHYEEIDERVYQQLVPYADRIWEIPGLGEEIAARSKVPGRIVCIQTRKGVR